MLPPRLDRFTIGKANILTGFTKNVDRQRIGKISSLASLDELIRLAAAFFDTPIAAIFIRVADRLFLKASVGLDEQTLLESGRICTSVIDDRAPLIMRGMGDPEELAALSKLGRFSSLHFCACLPLEISHGWPLAAFCIGDVKEKAEFSKADIANLDAFSAIAADLLKFQIAEQDRQAIAAEVAGLGHDIRTPMNGIVGMAELLLTSDDLSEKQRRRAETVKRSGATLLSMIEPLFDIARVAREGATISPSPVNLHDFVLNEFKRMQNKITCQEHSLSLACDFPIDSHVFVNSIQLPRLLSHFTEGAIDLSPDQPVAFEAACRADTKGVTFILSALITKLEENRRHHLVALLSCEGAAVAGSLGCLGLKLLACRQLARVMRGGIVASPLDQDHIALKLNICLQPAPLAGGLTQDSFQDSCDSLELEENSCGIDVLVAEDDPDMAALIQEFLEDAGHHVTVAPSGEAVMEILDQKIIDLVLMDGQLLDMSGLEAAGKIRALPDGRATLPIIALTGAVMAGDRERYLSAGMNDYLAKPVACDTLVEMIGRYQATGCGRQ